jgi:hypothetical protein
VAAAMAAAAVVVVEVVIVVVVVVLVVVVAFPELTHVNGLHIQRTLDTKVTPRAIMYMSRRMEGLYKYTVPAHTIREFFPLACNYSKQGRGGVYDNEYERKRARRCGHNLSGLG